jgi:hypothetical protein
MAAVAAYTRMIAVIKIEADSISPGRYTLRLPRLMARGAGAYIPLADYLVRRMTLKTCRMSISTRRDRDNIALRLVTGRAVRLFEVGGMIDLCREAPDRRKAL